MLIKGTTKNKTNYLVHKYNELISCGVNEKNILIITLNSFKKSLFHKNAKVLTFQGLCYNAFLDNKKYIASLINNNDENYEPNLCGLEISQFIFKQSIKEADFSDYISKVNLLHQLFRRYSLIVNNDLSNKEVLERSKFLKESFALDAQKAIDDYKLKTIQYKSFDYLRQMAILPSIYKNTDYFKNIEYLIVDDADEMPYAFWQFVDAIMPNLKDYFIAYDENGSSRCGYLCAYKNGIKDFKENYSPTEITLEDKNLFNNEAELFYYNLKKGEKTKFNNIQFNSGIRRLDMLDKVVKEIKNLISEGVKPNEIAIISPIIDDILLQAFSTLNYQTISGNEKLSNISEIKHLIILLKIVNGIEVKDYEIKDILINLLKIPYKKCFNIIKTKKLSQDSINNENYIKLISTLNSLRKTKYNLCEQIKILWENLIKSNPIKYDFFMKEARNFELAFNGKIENIQEQFLIQIENSVISENPAETISINNNCVLIGTPQKVIDYSLHTKYQFWLDISNNEWLKEDTGTLYNAWGLSRDFNKKEFTFEDNLLLTRDKAARIVRKLMFCSDKEIKFYSSLYDNTGNENFGGLNDFIEIEIANKKQNFEITPRADQKPVLEYKSGQMGIMAVPGAGKTTILLALITKLIKEGIKSENIFVLTYMESAAKNFKERIKSALPDNIDTPNISTIHGLALRIIKENSNFTKVGLDDKFEICDDTTKERIIKEILKDEEKFDNYLRCLSIVKLSNKTSIKTKHKEIQDFFDFYKKYNSALKEQNMIDYDDMLYFAVKILEEDKEALNYYQNLCQFIIEDEAQDSSEIQQRLLKLLSGKHKNLVRCGDINQAITSTFTNSDTQGFKNFLNNNKKVEMNSSQRCSKPIYSLANKLIKTTLKDENKKQAFYEIEMIGTSNNPKTQTEPKFLLFETTKDEKEFILEKVKEILKEEKNTSIAILLRLNSQVNEYNEFFLSQGIKTTVRTDCLSQKKIFKIILNVLKIIKEPLNNNLILEFAQNYVDKEDLKFIKELKEPFIHTQIDDLYSEKLNQLYWDIDYWLNQSTSSIEEIAQKIGFYYSKTSTDKANTYLVSTFIKRIGNDLEKIEYCAQRPLSAYKFFEEEIIENETSVNIMTMHKSKGDEFDYVFIPQTNEDNYPLNLQNVKLKSGGHFVQTIKSQLENSTIKMPDILKQEQIFETLRLLYVGITRAKSCLYITSAKINNRKKKITPSEIFTTLNN
ncbi:MAG: ATP-dependent helicase [Cyanobacteria bacterium SIG29]|nr:ATP-dependent helicase [Cyanobacteria bacterium SIG29]